MELSKLFRHKRHLSCSEVMEVLQAYLDGEIDAATARQVAGHLDACPPCGHESHIYDRIKSSLSRHRPDLDQTVVRALNDYADRILKGHLDG